MLARRDLERVLRSLIADEIGRARGRAVAPAELFSWADDATLDEDGVGVDSVDKLSLVQRVNEFFHLHEVGSEDHLVLENRLSRWVDIVAETLAARHERVTFRTSGSTGAPRPVTLEIARLHAELDAFDDEMIRADRVVAWTPPHHIYGFLFAALLPSRRGAPVVDARAKAPSFFGRAEPGDLQVATPFVWRRLFEAAPEGGQGAVGLASGAPSTDETWAAARASGLSDFIEIYGSTETAGVGFRRSGAAPFELLPIWVRGGRDVDGDALLFADRPDVVVAAPDRLVFDADGDFRVEGRRDRAVQVAGVNVSLDATLAALLAHPLVKDAAVRQNAADPDGRLKAFIVPAEPLDDVDRAAAELRARVAERLAAPARPTSFTFGAALPRNPGGKLTDWAV